MFHYQEEKNLKCQPQANAMLYTLCCDAQPTPFETARSEENIE
jgi:hypothetical protein